MRRRFDTAYIRSELERIGAALATSIDVFLIGGGAMAFRELKDTTKDIDLVTGSRAEFEQFQETVRTLGYEDVQSPAQEYTELGAQAILENEDGCRIDLFNEQVVDKLRLSEGMRTRAEQYFTSGKLTVQLVSQEDIFLFKAVAGRTDDVDDMFALAQTGLDFEIVKMELRQQTELLGQELFVTCVNEALADLADRHNLRTPLDEPVTEITNQVYDELAVLNQFDEQASIDGLQEAVALDPDEFDAVITRLVEKDVLAVTNGTVQKQSESL